MESAAVLRSFQCCVSTSSHLKSVIERPGMMTTNNAAFPNVSKSQLYGGKTVSSIEKHGSLCVKASISTVTAKSKSGNNGAVLSDSTKKGSPETKTLQTATFPKGFEALLEEVCEETKVAELKVKFGGFELHMKRKIEVPTPAPIVYPTAAPPVPSKPMNESTPAAPPASSSKTAAEKITPFTNVSPEKTAKLAALDPSSGYVIVSSPTVGSFRRAKTLKGKKQPPACKEGNVIKEGQVIGFLDQFGTELPVYSDVAGEVLKFLYNDGEAVGYGDPLIAVLPSFHGIK